MSSKKETGTGLKHFLISSSVALSSTNRFSSSSHYKATIMRFGVELLVVFLAVLQCTGFIVTYILAVNDGHVTPEFPYISDTGGKPPESCIFTMICCVSGIITLLIMYIRYVHIKQYYQMSINKILFLNPLTFFIGILSVFGLLLVGAFQDDEVSIVHMIGAAMVFGFGIVYMWLQTVISYKIYHASLTRHVSSVVIILRLFLSLMSTIFFIMVMVTMYVAGHIRSQSSLDYDPAHWTSKDPGYPLHLTSTISEWCLGLTFLVFFLTFHTDFSRVSLIVSVSLRQEYMTLNENTPLRL